MILKYFVDPVHQTISLQSMSVADSTAPIVRLHDGRIVAEKFLFWDYVIALEYLLSFIKGDRSWDLTGCGSVGGVGV